MESAPCFGRWSESVTLASSRCWVRHASCMPDAGSNPIEGNAQATGVRAYGRREPCSRDEDLTQCPLDLRNREQDTRASQARPRTTSAANARSVRSGTTSAGVAHDRSARDTARTGARVRSGRVARGEPIAAQGGGGGNGLFHSRRLGNCGLPVPGRSVFADAVRRWWQGAAHPQSTPGQGVI